MQLQHRCQLRFFSSLVFFRAVFWRCSPNRCLAAADRFAIHTHAQYIAGGSRAEGACIIYIWTVEGHLVTRLEGPNLGLLSLARHPVRPFLAAALTNGKVNQAHGTAYSSTRRSRVQGVPSL